MVQETYDCINEIETLLGESLELQQCGSITVASSEASLKGLEALEEAATRFGIPNERIPERQGEGVASVDRCGSGGCGALYAHRCLLSIQALLCSGYAKTAARLGVTLRPNCKVKEIMVEGGRVCGVLLADGECIEAPVVVNAAGSWANLLMRPLHVGLPFTPVRSHFWITKIDKSVFRQRHPFTVIPDARAFTRSDVGALIIGLRESRCQSFDPATLTGQLEDLISIKKPNGRCSTNVRRC